MFSFSLSNVIAIFSCAFFYFDFNPFFSSNYALIKTPSTLTHTLDHQESKRESSISDIIEPFFLVSFVNRSLCCCSLAFFCCPSCDEALSGHMAIMNVNKIQIVCINCKDLLSYGYFDAYRYSVQFVFVVRFFGCNAATRSACLSRQNRKQQQLWIKRKEKNRILIH